jgi:hypothetical protein
MTNHVRALCKATKKISEIFELFIRTIPSGGKNTVIIYTTETANLYKNIKFTENVPQNYRSQAQKLK